MSTNRHVILNYVDSPLKVLLWTKGELALYVLPSFIGMMVGQLALGLVVSGINIWMNRQYKKRFGKGQLQAVRYWFLPTGKTLKQLPPSHIREYLG